MMTTQVGIRFSWKDVEGNLPRECDVEGLHLSALRQAASGMLKGANGGRLSDSLYAGGKSVEYEGEWVLESEWRLRSRSA